MNTIPICVFLSVLYFFRVTAITFNVDAHQEECFYEEIPMGSPVAVMFQVIAGGFLDIDHYSKSPVNILQYNAERQTEGKYNFVATSAGLYSFCFSNKMSTLTMKTVSFVVKIGSFDVEEPKLDPGLVKQEHISNLQNSIFQLKSGLQAIVDEQAYIKMREQVHRNTSESTNSRVVWWSLFEVIMLIAMSLWQIYYLRRFFEVKRVV